MLRLRNHQTTTPSFMAPRLNKRQQRKQDELEALALAKASEVATQEPPETEPSEHTTDSEPEPQVTTKGHPQPAVGFGALISQEANANEPIISEEEEDEDEAPKPTKAKPKKVRFV